MLIGILEFQVDENFGVDAEGNGAGVADVLELRPVLSWNTCGNVKADDHSCNAPWRLCSHVLFRVHFGAVEVHTIFLRGNARSRDHAGRECGNDEVGRREALAAPVVIGRRVGDEFNLAWSVGGLASQLADVKCVLGNHLRSWRLRRFGDSA